MAIYCWVLVQAWRLPICPLVCLSVCLSGGCAVAKRLIESGSRLGWWVRSVEDGYISCGSTSPIWKGRYLGFFALWYEWRFECIFYSTGVEKLTIFPYGQYIFGNVCSLAFRGYSKFGDRSLGIQEIYKNVPVISRRNHASLQPSRELTSSWRW